MGGKGKTRKTRWRTLPIQDDHSDSEESVSRTTYTKHQMSYAKFTNSSQPNLRNHYQYDSAKSTRSSSTTSENKLKFNEDEYTKITTPRQDVLFKKGYLNKPRTFLTQTSTGNSTTSTGNGTPDHQSTDLEYESQFVFPNAAFVDQNGIYYVNSYEPYPLMVFNPTGYYPDYPHTKSKRCSTGSLTESMSPNNEEATSQDWNQSGGETSNNLSDCTAPMYSMVCQDYGYTNTSTESTTDHGQRLKKKRRRKSSKSIPQTNDSTSDYTDSESSNEVYETHPVHYQSLSNTSTCTSPSSELSSKNEEEETTEKSAENFAGEVNTLKSIEETKKTEETSSTKEEKPEERLVCKETEEKRTKYDLKPDAQEFIPRSYNPYHLPPGIHFVPLPIPMDHNMHFVPAPYPINFNPACMGYMPPFVHNEPINHEYCEVAKIEEINAKNEETVPIVQEIEPVITNNAINIEEVVQKLEDVSKKQEESQKVEEKIVEQPKPFIKNSRYSKINVDTRNNYKRKPFYNKKEENIISSEHKNTEKPKSTWRPYQSNNSSPRHTLASPHSPKPRYQLQNEKKYADLLKKEEKEYKVNIPETKNVVPVEISSVNSSPKKEEKIVKPNEWISVSSRKKRKNKNVEETVDFDLEEDKHEEIEGEFEVYDINLLEDVIPPSKLQEDSTTQEVSVKKEECMKEESIEKDESITNEKCVKLEEHVQITLENVLVEENMKKLDTVAVFPMIEVSELEKRLISIESIEEFIEELPIIEEKPKERKSPKKSRKDSQKPLTKKVMITDIDLSMTCEENQCKIEEIIEEKADVIETKKHDNKYKEIKEETTEESPKEKKSKKKKKKSPKTSPAASNNETGQNADEAYDFLLETVKSEEEEKTNVDVYEELDKMIQKGIYNSLEVKMKDLNIEDNPDFFKSIISNISKVDSKFPKAPDFNKILQSNRKFDTNSSQLTDRLVSL